MAFDKDRVLEEIQDRLREVGLPGSPGNPISAGMVERVIAHQGQVNLIVNIPPDLAKSKDRIKDDIGAAIRSIDGVDSVQVLEKVQPQAQGAPPQGAPSPGGPSGTEVPGVRHIIAVASGKGGVGKSTIAVNLALALSKNHRVGLLDSDVYGPSVPKMLALEGQRPEVLPGDRIVPIEAHGLRTMSIGFLLDDESPVIWRGPMVTGLLRQLLFQAEWGGLDYLILDLPPGTGDAQLTLVQSIALSGGIIVTTPQDVALLDVQRGIQMFNRVEVPILGIVENMSTFVCPHCSQETRIFSGGGGESIAKRYDVPFLGAVPLEASYATAGDAGQPVVVQAPESALAKTMAAVAEKVAEAVA
jgi:ATP-binding protein involved in chromosome partitioning